MTCSFCFYQCGVVISIFSGHFVFPFQSLVRKPLRERRKLLHDNFKEVEGEFVFAKSMTSSNTEDIAEFLDESIKGKKKELVSYMTDHIGGEFVFAKFDETIKGQ